MNLASVRHHASPTRFMKPLSLFALGLTALGATAVQAIPHLGRWAEQLYVFQRTPAPVPVRNNRPTDPAWAGSLQPGWQRPRMDNFNILVSGGTGAGKTTLLNVLSSFISDRDRIVTIEDAAELQLRQEHVVRLETRPPNVEGKGAVRQRQLVGN